MFAQDGAFESSTIGGWSRALGELHRRIGHRFARSEARERVKRYLAGLLGRVEPGAVATLRLPDGSLESNPGFVQLAVVEGKQVTQRAARDARAQLTIAQPASSILSRQWRFVPGQLTSRGLAAAR